MLKPVILISST